MSFKKKYGNANKIKDKTVDDAAIGDDKILVYKTSGDKIVYEAKPAGAGDMYKSTYDANSNNIVDNSEKLENNTLAQVRAHTLTESDISDLDHDAQKIKGKTVDDAAIADGYVLTYNSATGKVEYQSKSAGAYKLAPSYTIFKSGSTYYAMDRDGNNDYSGTKLGKVILDTIASLTSGGWVHFNLIGTHTLEIGIRGSQDNIRLSGLGKGVTELKIQNAKQSNLAQDSGASDTTIVVVDGSQFEEDQWVVINDDDSNPEQHYIDSIAGNTLTIHNGLVSAMTMAKNAKVMTASNLINLGNWDEHGGAWAIKGEDWVIEHLRLDGNRANQLAPVSGDLESCVCGLVIYNTTETANNVTMRDCIVEETAGCTFWILGSHTYPHHLTDCEFRAYGRWGLVYNESRCHIRGCNFLIGSGGASRPLEFENEAYGSVIDCYIHGGDNPTRGLTVYGRSSGNYKAKVRVIGNRIENCGTDSITLGQSGQTVQRVTCMGNTCDGRIKYYQFQYGVIMGNVCDDVYNAGGTHTGSVIEHNAEF